MKQPCPGWESLRERIYLFQIGSPLHQHQFGEKSTPPIKLTTTRLHYLGFAEKVLLQKARSQKSGFLGYFLVGSGFFSKTRLLTEI